MHTRIFQNIMSEFVKINYKINRLFCLSSKYFKRQNAAPFRLKTIILVVISGFILMSVQNTLKAEGVTLAYVDFPPYEFENDGRPDGILVIIVEEIFEKAGIPLELKFLPFKRAYELVKTGSEQIDGLFNFYKIDKRLPFFDYSEPIIKNPLVFFTRRDTVFQFSRIDDLKGLKIGVLRGYTYGREFDENPDFIKSIADSHSLNFRKLVLGRVDAYPCDKLVGLYVAIKEKLMPELVVHPVPLKTMDGHIGFAKGRHLDTIRKIDKEISNMRKTGKIESIINQFIENRLFDYGR